MIKPVDRTWLLEMNGFEVLARLKQDPLTVGIPVVVLTSKHLTSEEEPMLAPHATSILSKGALAGSDSAERLLHVLSAAGLHRERARG